jgi:hypothetical protein
VTAEALVERLSDNPRGLLMAVDELGAWFGSFDAYKRARGADVNKYLSMHRGAPVKVDRKSGDRATIHVPRAALSVVGTTQPRILARMIGQENRENGLLARLFVAMPPPAFAPWSEDDVSDAAYSDYAHVLTGLFELGLGPDGGPVVLVLSQDARDLWRAYHDGMMERASQATEDLSAAFSKLRGGALRIALDLTLTQAAEQGHAATLTEVDAVSMRNGIALAEWFAHEAERVYARLEEKPEEGDRRRLTEAINARGGRVTPYELAHGGPRLFRGHTEDAEMALQRLVDAGLGAWEEVSPGPTGGRPSRVFVLSRIGAAASETHGAGREPAVSDATPESGGLREGSDEREPPDSSRSKSLDQDAPAGNGASPESPQTRAADPSTLAEQAPRGRPESIVGLPPRCARCSDSNRCLVFRDGSLVCSTCFEALPTRGQTGARP